MTYHSLYTERRERYLRSVNAGVENTWYSASDFSKLRKNADAFQELTTYFVPVVLGVRKWDRVKCVDEIREIYTISDIAFVLLTLYKVL